MARWLSLLILLLCWTRVSAAPPKPLLWQVSDEDNSVYMLGSFHMLKAEDYPLAAAVNQAFDAAGKVYFEVAPEELNNPASVQAMMKTGLIEGGGTLKQILKTDTWKRLQHYCQTHALPIESFQAMKPWLAALTIANLAVTQAGFLPDLGLDKHYMDMAAIARKDTAGLETLSQQVGVFAQMAPKDQELFLNQTLKDMQNPAQLEQLHQRWRNGDAEGLLQLLSQDSINDTPAFYRRLNRDRNRVWLPQISAFLRENTQGDALVVVGSLHLLGADGLIELLKAQGFRVVRLH
ncbi:TraB/GumN family protein [Methylomicrobium lacus]|uniref:TraB/GumN family protein n=1 Tax=Methylomicrobium lacus TaxID=136992 RepID=UPI0035A93FED